MYGGEILNLCRLVSLLISISFELFSVEFCALCLCNSSLSIRKEFSFYLISFYLINLINRLDSLQKLSKLNKICQKKSSILLFFL